MLANKELKAFVPTIQPDKAKSFYRDILGLKLLSEDDGMEFDANKVLLRVITVPKLKAQAFTVLDWNVGNISSTIKHLNKKGVYFENYEFLDQDELGIWVSPEGSKVAWFKDPDRNILSLTE